MTRKALPTLFKIDDDQFRELLAHCARTGHSFSSSMEGAIFIDLEAMAEGYFKKQP